MEEKRDKKRNQTVYFTSISLVREKEIPYEGGELNHAEKAYAFIKDFLAGKDRECFVTVALDSRNCPAMVEISAVGGCNICFIEPREVFKQALLGNASSIICFNRWQIIHRVACRTLVRFFLILPETDCRWNLCFGSEKSNVYILASC